MIPHHHEVDILVFLCEMPQILLVQIFMAPTGWILLTTDPLFWTAPLVPAADPSFHLS